MLVSLLYETLAQKAKAYSGALHQQMPVDSSKGTGKTKPVPLLQMKELPPA